MKKSRTTEKSLIIFCGIAAFLAFMPVPCTHGADIVSKSPILEVSHKENFEIIPFWKLGDQWRVKAVYHSSLSKNHGWSEPIFWEYSVTEHKKQNSKHFYIVEIKSPDNKMKSEAHLSYQADCGKKPCGLSHLSKVELTKIRRGSPFLKVFNYEKAFPVQTEQSLIPYDTPVFPLASPSSDTFAVLKQVTRELKAVNTLKQEVRQTLRPKELPRWPSEKKLTQVTCSTDRDKLIFVQYWHKDFPWPLFGQNGNMKYWLVMEN